MKNNLLSMLNRELPIIYFQGQSASQHQKRVVTHLLVEYEAFVSRWDEGIVKGGYAVC
jgi:hypothetical protein